MIVNAHLCTNERRMDNCIHFSGIIILFYETFPGLHKVLRCEIVLFCQCWEITVERAKKCVG